MVFTIYIRFRDSSYFFGPIVLVLLIVVVLSDHGGGFLFIDRLRRQRRRWFRHLDIRLGRGVSMTLMLFVMFLVVFVFVFDSRFVMAVFVFSVFASFLQSFSFIIALVVLQQRTEIIRTSR